MVALKPQLAVLWAVLRILLVLLLVSPLSSNATVHNATVHGQLLQATTGAATSPIMIATPLGLDYESFVPNFDVRMSGSRPKDYYWTNKRLPIIDFLNPADAGWMLARDGAMASADDPTAFGAASRTVRAQPYWNQRVRFAAHVVYEPGRSPSARVTAFVRVIGDTRGGRPGPTLVVDNGGRAFSYLITQVGVRSQELVGGGGGCARPAGGARRDVPARGHRAYLHPVRLHNDWWLASWRWTLRCLESRKT